jgi:hypothetical protein
MPVLIDRLNTKISQEVLKITILSQVFKRCLWAINDVDWGFLSQFNNDVIEAYLEQGEVKKCIFARFF